MKKEIIREIEIPEGITVDVSGKNVKVSGKIGTLERRFRGKFNEETGLKEENCRVVRAITRQFVCHFGGCYA